MYGHRILAQLSLAAIAAGVAAVPAWAAPPAPRKIVAVLDSTQNFGNTRRAVNFYDVTDLSGGDVFNQQPLFSVWSGYEISSQLNFEDPDTITVNPVNGTVYMAAYDSGPAGVVDSFGDTQGDYDLYKVNYQAALKDFIDNGRARGTMYAPAVGPDGAANPQHPDHAGSTVNLSGLTQKIGEIARPVAPDGTFFDYKLQFVNPEQMLMLDNQTGADTDPDTVANDHQLRFVNRTSTTPGAATVNAPTGEGGYNAQTSQSWESTGTNVIDMDNGSGRSEPVSMAYVDRDGVKGVWVGESDGGGDDVSFFELDLVNKTATKKELNAGPPPYPTGFALDDNPNINPASNDGVLDWIRVDGQGNLLIGESGFFEPIPTEPKVIGRTITNYDAADTDGNLQNEVLPGAWDTSVNLPVSGVIDDDTAVTDGRFVAVDKGTGHIYFFDADSGGLPNVVGDVYVFDPATGQLIYSELNAANHFFEKQGIEFITRGDVTGDGLIDAADIDALFAAVLDPTLGGEVSAAVGQEWLDLTGEGSLTGVGGDADELVQAILGTEYGDANLDGAVSFGDFVDLQTNFGQSGGWASGDFNGDGVISFGDFVDLQTNFGFNNMVPPPGPLAVPASVNAVPEPSTVILFGLGFSGVLFRVVRARKSAGRRA